MSFESVDAQAIYARVIQEFIVGAVVSPVLFI